MKANQAIDEAATSENTARQVKQFNRVTDESIGWTAGENFSREAFENEDGLLSQFRAHLDQIEELNARLHFVLGEIRPLIRR